MADTLNNFGLAEIKTLKTANKMVLTDIDIKMPVNEIENIKPEYIRAGASIFGTEGIYGKAQESVVIPAGIYEVYFTSEDCSNFGNVVEINYYNCGNYYVAVDLDSRDKCINFWSSYNNSTGTITGANLGTLEPGLSTKNVGSYNFLNFLVYVPADTELSAADAKKWYKIMHPYVSCKITAEDTFELEDPSDASQLLIDRKTGNYADTDYTFKFRTPYPEINGGYNPCTGIRVSNTYNGAVYEICYLDVNGHEINDWLSNYSSSNNTIDFNYISSYANGNYIKPDTDQNIDPQVLAWIIVNLKTLNPTGATCKNCSTSTNVSKATNICDNCDKKFWINTDVYESVVDQLDYELVCTNKGANVYVSSYQGGWLSNTNGRCFTTVTDSTDSSPSIITNLALNTPYKTNLSKALTCTVYCASSDSVTCYTQNGTYDDIFDSYAGKDGELSKMVYSGTEPIFLRSDVDSNLYIKEGYPYDAITELEYDNPIGVYNIYGSCVLTSYGGNYRYSDFSTYTDPDSYSTSCQCPYEYCAATFYTFYEDNVTEEPRTCPACSNTIYFKQHYSDYVECLKTPPARDYWYSSDNFSRADYIDTYAGQAACPYEGCQAVFYTQYGTSVNNGIDRICPECENIIYFYADSEGYDFECVTEPRGEVVTGSKYWWHDNDFEITDDPDPACAASTSCAYACGASFYLPWGAWDGASFGWRVCPQCDQNIYFTFDMTDGYNFQCTKGPATPSDPSKYYYFDDADLTWYEYWPEEGMNYRYDDCPSCNRNLYMNTSIPATNTICPYTDCNASIRISGYTISTNSTPPSPPQDDTTFTNMSENTSYYVAYTSEGWSYYKFTAPATGSYYVKSTSLEGDMDCYIFMNRDSCLSGENSDCVYGDGNTGDFNYEVSLSGSETIYMKVRQYRDVSDGYFSISRDSSVTPPETPETPPDSGSYICNNCGTDYSTESARDKCRNQDGCPYFLLCPSCGTYTGYSEAILCESCGGGENPNPPGDEEGTYCDNHGGYYYGDYCDECYDRCGYCGQTYYKGHMHYCGCPACNYPEYMQDGGYCSVCNYPDHSYNSCGCVATSSDYYDGDSGHKICGTCGNYADM